jgi:SAM-dependent methyltransferase
MREWLEGTVGRILALRPKKVLEIGCGLGMILFKVAPHCESYLGCDISERALEYVRGQLEHARLGRERVSLSQRAADKLSDLGEFDVVILNSTVQYFPNAQYLLEVLTELKRHVTPGGTIFVGDVRNLALLGFLHTSIEFHRAKPSTRLADLQRTIRSAVMREQELCVAPEFFEVVQEMLGFEEARTCLKRGRSPNELVRFRYDVLLRVPRANQETHPGGSEQVLHWEQDLQTLPKLEHFLAHERPPRVTIGGIQNARFGLERSVVEALKSHGGRTVEEIRSSTDPSLVHPEDVWALGEAHNYSVECIWPSKGAFGSFSARLVDRSRSPEVGHDRSPAPSRSAYPAGVGEGASPWSGYVSDPMHGFFASQVAPGILKLMKGTMPAPAIVEFCLLEKLPRLTSGEVDRQALPKVDERCFSTGR